VRKRGRNEPETLRLKLLGNRMSFVTSEMDELCVLTEHLAGDKRGRGKNCF